MPSAAAHGRPDTARLDRVYYALFFVAGMPALIYQVTWQRVLTLYFGVDIYSTSVTVASFMLGLGLGSLAGGRVADRFRRPTLLYSAVELLIGAFGFASVSLFTYVGHSFAGYPLSAVVPINFVLLLVPSFFMGVTLPVMCRMVCVRNHDIGRQLSKLYGLNTLGAAVGAVATAYVLIGLLGIDGATYVAAAINVSLAAIALAIGSAASSATHPNPSEVLEPSPVDESQLKLSRRDFYLLSFCSGFVGLGYEIVWYRILGCLLHGTVYVFGTILGVYLIGIAAGSLAAKRTADRPGAIERFAFCHLGIAIYTFAFFALLGQLSWLPGLRHVLAASTYTAFHPSPDLFTGEFSLATLYSLLDTPLWTLALLGVPTFLMGYGFPNLLRAAGRSVQNLGRSVGSIYFANILGSTAGTLFVGFVAIHYLGTELTLLLLITLGSIPILRILHAQGIGGNQPATARMAGVFLTLLLVGLVFPRQGKLIRAIHYADFPQVDVIAQAEDRSGVVLLKVQHEVITFPEEQSVLHTCRLYIDGANQGGLSRTDAPTADDMVRLALAAHSNPRRVLCIGLGNGSMCVAAENWPGVEELVVVELNSALASVLNHTANGRELFASPKLTYVEDDGRHWLLAHPNERFDIIMMFPFHAAHAHSGSLFSREFVELVQTRLNRNGIFFVRTVDPYSTARTLANVFPHVLRAQRNCYIAANHEPNFDVAKLGWSQEQLVDCLQADQAAILANTSAAPINRDLRPNAEFYLTYPYRRWLVARKLSPPYASPNREQFARLAISRADHTATLPTSQSPK